VGYQPAPPKKKKRKKGKKMAGIKEGPPRVPSRPPPPPPYGRVASVKVCHREDIFYPTKRDEAAAEEIELLQARIGKLDMRILRLLDVNKKLKQENMDLKERLLMDDFPDKPEDPEGDFPDMPKPPTGRFIRE